MISRRAAYFCMMNFSSPYLSLAARAEASSGRMMAEESSARLKAQESSELTRAEAWSGQPKAEEL